MSADRSFAPEILARRRWMGLAARSRPARLRELLAELPTHEVLRAPEIGAVMVQGRAGGTGAAFNLGEMTVTRCSVRIEDGTIGHAHVQGRDRDHARRAAVLDALMQTDAAQGLERTVLAPLAEDEATRRASRASRAAATRVEFFTLVRGEDQ